MEDKVNSLIQFQKTALEEIRYILNNTADKEYSPVKFRMLEEEMHLRNSFISDLENILNKGR